MPAVILIKRPGAYANIYIYGNIIDLASPFYFRMMKKLRRLLMRRNTKVS